MHNARNIWLAVGIDCECDKGPGWRTQKPLSFVSVYRGIVEKLQPVFEAHGSKATYLLSPEVMKDERSVSALRGLAARSELGTHLHAEYAEPETTDPEVTSAFQRDLPPGLERAKLASLTALFRSGFGYDATSFRAGRFGIGPHTLPALESLGYRVESSVTPSVDWSGSGATGLDFRGSPTQPYRPDPSEPGKPGGSPLLEVPVTIRPSRAAPFAGPFARFLPVRWLRPTWGSEASIVAVARDEIRAAPEGKPVILNAMFHNVEVIAGASPYAQNEREAAGILKRLSALLAFVRSEGGHVIGLSDIENIIR